MQVSAIRTPLTAQTVAQALDAASSLNDSAITILTTQVNVETGWNNCWNWNVGNIAGQGGDYVMLHSSDGTYRPYRAFPSLGTGVSAYLNLLKSRYSAALNSASQGDLTGFASNLKAKGYYEESESSYLNALESRYPSVAKALGTTINNVQLVPANIAGIIALGLVIGAGSYIAYEEAGRVVRRLRYA